MTEEVKEKEKEFAAEIKGIGDKIVALTLLQARDLADYLKDVHGIEPASGGAVMMAPAGPKKIQVIKTVREITSLGLKEAKSLVDNAPKPVKEGATKEEAEEIKKKLEAEGAKVEVK